MTDPIDEYKRRYQLFMKTVAGNLQAHVTGFLTETSNIERVTARAKEPARFEEKAYGVDEQGQPKYKTPLTEIQDQFGVRVIVFYREDVNTVIGIITRYFQPIEQRELVPESEWAFGYFGQHLVLPLPRDVVPQGVELKNVPKFFELQIKTLFQHAWSEANHDLGYKTRSPLSTDQKRRLAYTSAQAWGADRVFDELRSEIYK